MFKKQSILKVFSSLYLLHFFLLHFIFFTFINCHAPQAHTFFKLTPTLDIIVKSLPYY